MAGTSFPMRDRETIIQLADAYWKEIKESERLEEQAFERELPALRAAGYLSKPVFVRLARWKSVRPTRRYESNSDEQVRAATESAFAAADAAGAIAALTQLRGVALRTATAILHWMRPQEFPILDFRVLSALGEPHPKSFENVGFYSRVADRVRALAAEHALDLRTIDRALWAWDRRRPR